MPLLKISSVVGLLCLLTLVLGLSCVNACWFLVNLLGVDVCRWFLVCLFVIYMGFGLFGDVLQILGVCGCLI